MRSRQPARKPDGRDLWSRGLTLGVSFHIRRDLLRALAQITLGHYRVSVNGLGFMTAQFHGGRAGPPARSIRRNTAN
jgi:hypothetical protein